jgi:hypothetical protein
MKTFSLPLLVFAVLTSLAHAGDVSNRSSTLINALEVCLKKKASEITAADLATVTDLKLPHIHIPAFKDDDFAGLTNLKRLHFYSLFHRVGPKKLNASPPPIGSKVFAKLSSLEELILADDQLGTQLPDDVFAGLTSLKVLELSKVTLPKLPRSMLNLPNIEAVYYDGKGMSPDDYATLKKVLGDKLKPTREGK